MKRWRRTWGKQRITPGPNLLCNIVYASPARRKLPSARWENGARARGKAKVTFHGRDSSRGFTLDHAFARSHFASCTEYATRKLAHHACKKGGTQKVPDNGLTPKGTLDNGCAPRSASKLYLSMKTSQTSPGSESVAMAWVAGLGPASGISPSAGASSAAISAASSTSKSTESESAIHSLTLHGMYRTLSHAICRA